MVKFLLIVLIIYFVVVILFRFVFPYILVRFVKRLQRKVFDQDSNFQQKEYQTKKNGEINVDFIPPKSETNTNHVGEYVDYEEL